MLFFSATMTCVRTSSAPCNLAGLTPNPRPFRRNMEAVVMCRKVLIVQNRRKPRSYSLIAILSVFSVLLMTSCTCAKSVGVS